MKGRIGQFRGAVRLLNLYLTESPNRIPTRQCYRNRLFLSLSLYCLLNRPRSLHSLLTYSIFMVPLPVMRCVSSIYKIDFKKAPSKLICFNKLISSNIYGYMFWLDTYSSSDPNNVHIYRKQHVYIHPCIGY